MEDHPTVEDFRDLLQQSSQVASAERTAIVVRHLLAGCEVCRSTVRSLRGVSSLFARLFEYPIPTLGSEPAVQYNYDWTFAKAERSVAQHLAHGPFSRHLPEKLTELDHLPVGEQIHRVSIGKRFSDPDLIECLIERSHSSRYQSARKTFHSALLARLASEQCTPDMAEGDDRLADLQARAWGAFANAQRIQGNLVQAEEAFDIAFSKWSDGTNSRLIQADLLSKHGALLFFQRRFEEAIDSVEKAERIYQDQENLALYYNALVQKALILTMAGNASQAVPLLHRALSYGESDDDPYFPLVVRHNLFLCYIELDQPDEALAIHVESRDLYQKFKDTLIQIRATWQEGNLLREISHFHNAKAALIRARQGFMEQDLAYEAAMVSLDLAEVYQKLGHFEDLRRTLAEALPIFRSLRVGREMLASLYRLQQAVEEEDSGA